MGYEISAIRKDPYPTNPFYKVLEILKNTKVIVFDVGANTGSSIEQIKKNHTKSTIYAFEPSPRCISFLQKKYKHDNQVNIYQTGVGRREYYSYLNENECSDMNSFLSLGTQGWGKIKEKIKVPIVSLDFFTKNKKIEKVHLLKVDTQGFEMEVFKGAKGLFKKNAVGLVLFEVNFLDIYKKAPRFNELLTFFFHKNFKIVNLYDVTHISNCIGWCDILMINPKFFKQEKQKKS